MTSVLETECKEATFRALCYFHYPRCTTFTGGEGAAAVDIQVPRLACKRVCEQKLSFCPVDLAETLPGSQGVWDCNADTFESGSLISERDLKWIDEFAGMKVFPESTYSISVDGVGLLEAKCYGSAEDTEAELAADDPAGRSANGTDAGIKDSDTCSWPYVQNPNPYADGSQYRCILSCPSPMYSESELKAQWFAYIIPGLLTIPTAILLFSGKSAMKGLRSFRSRRARGMWLLKAFSNVQLFGLLALLTVLVGVLPSAVFFTDLVCTNESEYGKGSSRLCWLNRSEVFLQQLLFARVTLHVFALHQVIVKGSRNSIPQVLRGHPTLRVAAHVCPVFLCALWLAHHSLGKEDILNADPYLATPIQQVNQLRETFYCAPLFSTPALEFSVVLLPGLLLSAISGCFVVSIARVAFGLATVSLHPSRQNWRVVCENILKVLDPSRLSLVLISVGCIILFTLQVISSLYLYPQLEEFGREAQLWGRCVREIVFCEQMEDGIEKLSSLNATNIDYIVGNCRVWLHFAGNNQGCGDRSPAAPSHSIMVMKSFADGFFPFFLCLSFSLKSIKKAFLVGKNGMLFSSHGRQKEKNEMRICIQPSQYSSSSGVSVVESHEATVSKLALNQAS
jgi:hypothetical protein